MALNDASKALMVSLLFDDVEVVGRRSSSRRRMLVVTSSVVFGASRDIDDSASSSKEGENMPLERSVFVDNAGDARGGVQTIGGVFVSSDDEESLFIVVVVCAFTPKPEIRICGTSFGKGEEPFTPDELRKFAGDDDAADFPYDSDILFCTDDDIVVGFGDDENAAAKTLVAAELIFFSLCFYPFFWSFQENLQKGAFVFFHPYVEI